MKKTYINPEMEIILVTTQQMLASSDVNAPIDDTPTGNSEALGHENEGYDW